MVVVVNLVVVVMVVEVVKMVVVVVVVKMVAVVLVVVWVGGGSGSLHTVPQSLELVLVLLNVLCHSTGLRLHSVRL